MRDRELREREREGPKHALLAQLRAGILTRDQLVLAAALGSAAACEAWGELDGGQLPERAAAFRVALGHLDPSRGRSFACDCAERADAAGGRDSVFAPRRALRVARRFAEGEASAQDLAQAHHEAEEACYDLGMKESLADHSATMAARPDLKVWACAEVSRLAVAREGARRLVDAGARREAEGAALEEEHSWQALRLAEYVLGPNPER